MLAGGADDVLKSNKMEEKNDKSVMTKAEQGTACLTHSPLSYASSETLRDERGATKGSLTQEETER